MFSNISRYYEVHHFRFFRAGARRKPSLRHGGHSLFVISPGPGSCQFCHAVSGRAGRSDLPNLRFRLRSPE